MKTGMTLLICGAALGCIALASCGGGHSPGTYMPPVSPPPAKTMELDTAAVLAIVRTQTSETATPFDVADGAVAVTPVGDETSAPIAVDAT
jgi:hypothetical protein